MTTTPRIHLLLIISCLLVSVHSRLHKSHKQQDGSTEQVTSQSDPNSELESQPPDAVENEMPTVHQESRRDEQDDINHVSEGMAAAVSGKEGFNSEQELDGVSEVQDDSSMTDKKEDGLTPHNADHHQQQREEEQQEEQRGVEEKESNGMGGEGLEQTTVSEDKGGAVTTASGDDDQLDTAKDMESVGDQQEISEMRTGVDRSVVESDTATEEQDKSEVTGVGGEHEQDLEQTTDQTADQDVERTTLEGRHPELVIDGMSGEGSDSSGEEKEGNEEECVEDDRKTDEEPKEEVYQRGLQLVLKIDPINKLEGYKLLMEAAESGHTKALEQLAYGRLFGSVLERNFTQSFEIFSQLAEKGNPIGQQGLAFMYSTGIGVNSSQAKALLYYTFAALGGHYFAQMTMGYRSLMGINVAQSCEAALSYYHKAAQRVVDEVTLITGGLLVSKVRLMEEDNEATNVYGVSEDDMIHYNNVFADSGNTGAQVLLGVYYMFGMAGAERNFKMALKFLGGAAKEGFAAANALIGKIYAEGSSDVPQDYYEAMKYFKRARDMGHADGYSGMGVLYFYGMGVDQDYATALEYFQKATEKGSAEAQYYLGNMFYEGLGTQPNAKKALRYFQLASHGGHILAIYKLGEMHTDGRAVKRNCNYAVELFKGVAERGKWTRVLEDAERSYMDGDLDSALMVYLLLAEMGLEVAQTNAAYILEQDSVTVVQEKETLKRALILWNRAASQGYSMARVKLGDYYYYGQGTDVNYEAAASQYRIASDKQSSAQAMFNLAYMYQQGYGLQKDYHLAKRYYDMAAETSGEAHVPVVLALIKLNLLYYYDSYLQVMSSPTVVHILTEIEAVGGENWDIYLITVLAGLLVLVVMWRWRQT